MSTVSTTAQLKAIAQHIQGYTGPTGDTVNALIGGRLYLRRPAADAPFPHVVLRKQGGSTDPMYANLRETFELEATCYGRGRSQEELVDSLADLVQQALIVLQNSARSVGLSFSKSIRRDSLPFAAPPADKEVFTVRLLAECASWPAFLTAVT